MTFWSLTERTSPGQVRLGDGCGVAAASEPGGFILSSGFGKLLHHNALSGLSQPLIDPATSPVARDNHLTTFSL